MKIVLIFRSRTLNFYSIENVFGTIINDLSAKDEVESLFVEKPGFRISNLFLLRKLIKRKQKDTIYHVTGDVHYVVFALPRKRTVLTIHDCVFIHQRKGIKGWIIKKLYLDWPVRYVPAITVISEKTKHEVISLTGCNSDKIRVINNPVSAFIRFSKKKFNCEKPVFLFIGTLPNKNLDRTLDALEGLSFTINIIGNPTVDQVSKMEKNKFHFIIESNLSNEEMAKRYDQADVILFPSLYEGFGLPVLEGFKAGKAVLTSKISPLKELSGEAAWLVDPYNSESIRSTLKMIIQNEELRNKKIKSGLDIAQNYSSEKVASLYHETYSDLSALQKNNAS